MVKYIHRYTHTVQISSYFCRSVHLFILIPYSIINHTIVQMPVTQTRGFWFVSLNVIISPNHNNILGLFYVINTTRVKVYLNSKLFACLGYAYDSLHIHSLKYQRQNRCLRRLDRFREWVGTLRPLTTMWMPRINSIITTCSQGRNGKKTVESCTLWYYFEIWHGVRVCDGDHKNHWLQVGKSLWWPVAAKFKMAATDMIIFHISGLNNHT